ncbi:MAG TPA: hypothetical protein VFT22_22610 [Kofleriaceae bacterium]|nr:hypothetical protein [Kofleriaceae bacterium]
MERSSGQARVAAGPGWLDVAGRVRAWARRTAEIHDELAAIAEVDPRWWLLAGGVALAEPRARADVYLACDAEPDGDTFMGYRAPRPRHVVVDAIHRASAARAALRELDGGLPDQPLAVTIDRTGGPDTRPSALEVAAFAVGDRCLVARLDDPALPAQLAAVVAGAEPPAWRGATPFVCVSIGDEPLETARHGHRRAWSAAGGPWLGLGRSGEVAVVSTCHLVIDGYGHAWITGQIAKLARLVEAAEAAGSTERSAPGALAAADALGAATPRLAAVAGAVPLAVVWRELACPTPRVIPLAYELGCILHRHVGRRDARFSPTIQIPVARGRKDDPLRLRQRIVSATTSVRFEGGVPEPFAVFEARVRGVFSREAEDRGLVSRLLAAARAVPVPVAWKRKGIGAKRPRWLESFAEVIGGRALLSRIVLDAPIPPLCAVSSPARLASEADPAGGCVVTIIEDGRRGAITLCGSGFAGTAAAGAALLDELLSSSRLESVARSRAQGGRDR